MIIAVLFKTFNLLVEVITVMLLIRAVLSWFPFIDTDNSVIRFIYTLTETLIEPVRRGLNKIDFVRRCPLDFSLIATYLLIRMIQKLVEALYYSLW